MVGVSSWHRDLSQEGVHPHPGPEIVIPSGDDTTDEQIEMMHKWDPPQGTYTVISGNIDALASKWPLVANWPCDAILLQEVRLNQFQQKNLSVII